MLSVGIAAADGLQVVVGVLSVSGAPALAGIRIVVEVPAVACFPDVARFHAVAGLNAVAGILTVAGVFLCFADVHAVARILEDVAIPFVADIPAVDGFSAMTFRYCCCFCCRLRACSCDYT